MDSINKNQQEDNYEDLAGDTAKKKIQELIKKNDTCFFCTRIHTNKSFVTRPMSVQKTDDEGNLWFLSAVDSNKNAEIKTNPAVQMLFRGSDHSDFLTLYGTASISKDKAMIKELWNPMVKAWFTGGVDDPGITVIKVAPSEGYYWDTKHGNVVAFVKTMIGAAIGKTMDDSVEGKINV
ncbi:MAG TPA: pyridoxamine 5'-phosphate oxidase family protein [Ferruginibacter sp.]|nr:pyridoxamine 5'-phosphate oxidase family protein [Ferruginibacter sp.]